jgi:hypothetical protein
MQRCRGLLKYLPWLVGAQVLILGIRVAREFQPGSPGFFLEKCIGMIFAPAQWLADRLFGSGKENMGASIVFLPVLLIGYGLGFTALAKVIIYLRWGRKD